MDFLFKLKWLSGPLAGRELALPPGEIRLGGVDPDIAVALEQGASTVLSITPAGVTAAPPVPAWADGHPWDPAQPFPLGVVLDLAGQAFVLGEPDAALPALAVPSRSAAPGTRIRYWPLALGCGGLACGGVLAVVLLIGQAPTVVRPFDVAAWLSAQLSDPAFAGLRAERDGQGGVILKGLCVSSQAIETFRTHLRDQGLLFRDESVGADTLRKQVHNVLELNGYRDVEVIGGATLDTVEIRGAILADASWLHTTEQLRAIKALHSWQVMNDRAGLFDKLVGMLRRRSLLEGLGISVSGKELLVSGQLDARRAQALAAVIAAFNEDGPPRLKARFQNIPPAAPTADILPGAIVSLGGNADSIYVELANGMRLQQGSMLPSGYVIDALSTSSMALVKGQRLISIRLNL